MRDEYTFETMESQSVIGLALSRADNREEPGVAVNPPLASIVIPAHNEASVLKRCLSGFAEQAREGLFEVCIVSNGSDDATVQIAREATAGWPHARVEELSVASKSAALRRADEVCTVYPRIYLDADIAVEAETLLMLADELRAQPFPAVAAPGMQIDTTLSSWPVKAYHRVWQLLPYVSEGVIGSGIYAVNTQGAHAVGEFPDALNDDAFVRSRFTPEQRLTTTGDFTMFAPHTVTSLVRRRARVHLGNQDPVLAGDGGSTSRSSIVDLLRSRKVHLHEAMIYASISLAAFGLASLRQVRGESDAWSTDLTSRENTGRQVPKLQTYSDGPDVSILMVTYNAADWTERALAAIADGVADHTYEIIVVDNHSTSLPQDTLLSWVDEQQSTVRFLDENIGFGRGMNYAAGLASGRHLLLLNPDAIVEPGAIDTLVNFLDAEPDRGIVGGRIFAPDGSLDYGSCFGRQNTWSLICFGAGLSALFPRSALFNPEGLGSWERDTVREVGVVTGCMLLADHRLWDELDGFDPQFFMYGEDADMCHRARGLGYRPSTTPDARAVHAIGQSSATTADKQVLLYRGKATLVRKSYKYRATTVFGISMLRAGVRLRAAMERYADRGNCWRELSERESEWIPGW